MNEVDALLFDVDGTLAETEEVHRQSFNEAFAAAGLDWVWSQELYRKLLAVTGGKERIRYYMDVFLKDFAPPRESQDFIAGLHRAKTAFYTRTVASGEVPLRPGVRRLLEEARATGLRLAIATTTTPDNVTALLEHSLGRHAPGWFDVIGAGSVVPAKKPAPDIYRYVLDELGAAPEHCLAFEDSENGLRSARGAGVQTLVTVSEYSRGQDFGGAALVVNDLGEPDRPFTVLAGDPCGASYVDMGLVACLGLRRISEFADG